jgi:hypothetical protein
MKSMVKVLKVAGCFVLVLSLAGTALASCGDSMNAMAARAALIRNQSSPSQSSSSTGGTNANSPSIVGLWHIRFVVGDQTIQEAYQIWNFGGTEVHNPNVDPRGGSVCLGAWVQGTKQTFKLTHRVWSYDASGNFMGTIHLTESVTLAENGNTQGGSFTLDFYDPDDNFMFSVPGSVVGERITPE